MYEHGSSFDKRDYLRAAANLVEDVPDRQPLLLSALEIASAEDTLAAEFERGAGAAFGLGGQDVRPIALQLAAQLASSEQDRSGVRAAGLRLMTSPKNTTSVLQAFILAGSASFRGDVPLLAAHPDESVRAFAAAVWAKDPAADARLGLSLAHDSSRAGRINSPTRSLDPTRERRLPRRCWTCSQLT